MAILGLVVNALLVVAAFAAIRVAYKTLVKIAEQTEATKRAAEAAERSIALQETVQQQWIEIGGWRRQGGSSREENPPHFTIAAELTNPTNIPLNIKVISMATKGAVITRTIGNMLAPGASITMDYPIILNQDQTILYQSHRLVLAVTGYVEYVDAFGKGKKQSFNQWCVCGRQNYFQSRPMEISDQSSE
jgi:hypothetical protein